MPNGTEHCHDHTGCVARIDGLENSDRQQWDEMGEQRKKMDGVINRINVTMGMLLVTMVGVILNLVLK